MHLCRIFCVIAIQYGTQTNFRLSAQKRPKKYRIVSTTPSSSPFYAYLDFLHYILNLVAFVPIPRSRAHVG
jgi:hypothetical protein